MIADHRMMPMIGFDTGRLVDRCQWVRCDDCCSKLNSQSYCYCYYYCCLRFDVVGSVSYVVVGAVVADDVDYCGPRWSRHFEQMAGPFRIGSC